MRITGLDGKSYEWKIKQRRGKRSGLHKRAVDLIRKLFPHDVIYQEIPLPGTKGLAADIYLPAYMLMVEVNGRQHYEEIPHFHGSSDREIRLNFVMAQGRDIQKKAWCELNGITLISLPYNEDDEQWSARLQPN